MNTIRGKVWKFGDSINTDIISPTESYYSGAGESATTMAAIRPEFPKEVKPGDIIVAGRNFGCGSHRESANIILREKGVSAIIAESVARLFFRISISLAYPTFAAKGISDIVEDGDTLEINYNEGKAINVSTGKSVSLTKYPPSIEAIFSAGGLLPLLKQRMEKEGL